MFGGRNKLRDIDFAFSIAAVVDSIDANECAPNVVGGSLAKILLDLHYSDIDSYSAGRVTMLQLGTRFSSKYWQASTYGNKTAVFIAALKTAIRIIEDGEIDEETKKQVRDTLARPE